MPRIDDYKNTLEIAKEEFRKKDPRNMASDSGAEYRPNPKGETIELLVLDRAITITWPEGEIVAPDGN